MDKYDLAHYQEVDQEFVESVSKMDETDTLLLEMQDMNGEPIREDDGTIVEVPLSKKDCDGFLDLMRDKALTFNEIVVQAIQFAADEEISEEE